MQTTSNAEHTVETAARSTGAWALAWRDGLVAFLAGRVFYSLVGYLIWLTRIRPKEADQFYTNITPILDGPAGALLGVWQRWDGIHYQAIVEQGYSADYLTAFFPLYPWLAGALHRLTGLGSLPALILISNLAFLISLVLLHRLVSRWYQPRLARAGLLSLVLFPTAFFFYAVYPQSLLLLWMLVAIDQAQRQRWWAAAGAALLAGLTHGSAVVLIAPFLVAAWQAGWRAPCLAALDRLNARWKGWRSQSSTRQPPRPGPGWRSLAGLLPALLPPVAPLAGIACFMVWRSLAGFRDYAEVQNQGWERTLHWPWQALVDFTREILETPLELSLVALWLNILVLFLVIALTAWSFRRIPWILWWLQAAALGFLLVHYVEWNPLLSFFRLILVAFPVYIEIALLGERKPWRLVFFTASLLLALISSALFFMWQGSMT